MTDSPQNTAVTRRRYNLRHRASLSDHEDEVAAPTIKPKQPSAAPKTQHVERNSPFPPHLVSLFVSIALILLLSGMTFMRWRPQSAPNPPQEVGASAQPPPSRCPQSHLWPAQEPYTANENDVSVVVDVLQSQVTDLSQQLRHADAELDAAHRTNVRLIQEVTGYQQQIHDHYANTNSTTSTVVAVITNVCNPIDALFISSSLSTTTQQSANANSSANSTNNETLALTALGVLTLVFASIALSSRHTTGRLTHTITTLTQELQELAFEKDTAEQSVSILEMELQRKVKQLAEVATSQYNSQQNQATSTPHSPRIRAYNTAPSGNANTFMTRDISPQKTPLLAHNNTSSTRSPLPPTPPPPPQSSSAPTTPGDTLPPPPRQLVERFLQERGAIAIEQEQVMVWLEMEEAFDSLKKEVNALREVARGVEQVEEQVVGLSKALEEQRAAARAAKEALNAVRQAANS